MIHQGVIETVLLLWHNLRHLLPFKVCSELGIVSIGVEDIRFFSFLNAPFS